MTRPAWLVNVALAVAAVLLTVSVSSRVGRAGRVEGAPDGRLAIQTAVDNGLGQADAATRGRPLVPLIARAAGGPASPLRAPILRLAQFLDLPGNRAARLFTVLNVVYAALLAFAIGLLLDAIGASAAIKAVVVVNLFATTALARLPAYQPVQIELGACVFVTLAVYAVIAGGRAWIMTAAVLAVLAHGAAVAVVLLGLLRNRQRGLPFRSAAAYAPALAVFAAVADLGAPDGIGRSEPAAGAARPAPLVAHPELLVHPSFVVPALYAGATVSAACLSF